MKKLLLILICFLYFNFAFSQSSIVARAQYNTYLNDSVVTFKTLSSSIHPYNVGLGIDSAFALIASLDSLVSGGGGLPAVLAINNVANSQIELTDGSTTKAIYTESSFNVYHSISDGIDASLGLNGGAGILALKDRSGGFYGITKAGVLTGTRTYLTADEPLANGVGLPSTPVLHWTNKPIVVYGNISGSLDTTIVGADGVIVNDNNGNKTTVTPSFTDVLHADVTGTEIADFEVSNSALTWSYVSPVGSTDFLGTLHFHKGTPSGISNFDYYLPGANGTLVEQEDTVGGSGEHAVFVTAYDISNLHDTVLGVTYSALDSAILLRMLTRRLIQHTSGLNTAEFAVSDNSASSDTFSLPSNPAQNTIIAVKITKTVPGHTTTVICTGVDTFNVIGGSKFLTLSYLNQAVMLFYDKTSHFYTVMDIMPKSANDGMYAKYTDTPGIISTATSTQNAIQTDLISYQLKTGRLNVNYQTGTSYTFVLTDSGKTVNQANASASTYTVPNNSTVAFPLDTYIQVENFGSGTLTFSPAVGVTIHTANADANLKLYPGMSCYLHKIGTNTIWISGGNGN